MSDTSPSFAAAAAPVLQAPVGTIAAFAGPVTPQWEDATGWLKCDGRQLDRTASGDKFMALFNAIGSSWGGDGVNLFNVPDLCGRFLRGVDEGRGNDPEASARQAIMPGGHAGDKVGSLQADALQQHTHKDPGHRHPATASGSVTLPRWFSERCENGDENQVNGNEGNQGDEPHAVSVSVEVQNAVTNIGDAVQVSGGTPVATAPDTRPRNASVFWIIRWK